MTAKIRCMSFSPEPVRRPREQVEKQLRDAIMASTFKQGERLPSEPDLAREFQVSRSAIREALRVLVSGGLIAKVPGAGGGSFVQSIDHDSLKSLLSGSLETIMKFGSVSFDEVNDVRRMLEVPAARLAAENRTEEQAAELRRLIKRQEEMFAESRDDHDPELYELGQSISRLVGEASGNRLLASFVSALSQVTVPVYMRELRPDEAEAARDRSRSLVDAIDRKDSLSAEAAMSAQLAPMRHHAA